MLERTISEYQGHKDTLRKMIEKMQEAIDFTPDNPEAQKELLAELRQRKKELQIQKREVLDGMRAIRVEARQQSTKAGAILGGLLYDSAYAARQRRGIRYAKETALRPHEDLRAAIERQIMQAERDILWVKKFK